MGVRMGSLCIWEIMWAQKRSKHIVIPEPVYSLWDKTMTKSFGELPGGWLVFTHRTEKENMCMIIIKRCSFPQTHSCGISGLQRNLKCSRSSGWCHSSMWTHILPESMFAVGGMLRKCGARHFSPQVWSRRRLWLFGAGCQYWLTSCPGHQDWKNPWRRLWQKYLLNSLLHCTLPFFHVQIIIILFESAMPLHWDL